MKKVIVVIFQDVNGDILLVKNSIKRSNKWSLVSGDFKKGETYIDCFQREVEEETGWRDCEINKEFEFENVFKNEKCKVFLLLCRLNEKQKAVKGEENLNGKWIRPEEIKNLDINSFVKSDLQKVGILDKKY
jgi:ADP-ribose pyrophosphatase YjhB (NUDIX family)